MKPHLILAIALTAAALVGCNRHKDEFANLPLTPLPPVPAWATALMGTETKAYTASTDCQGAFDALYNHHKTEPMGAEANGWGWLTAAKAPPTQILLADSSDKIIGAGQVDYERPDVGKALTEVTATKVGWHAVMVDPAGQVTAYAFLPDKTICRLGSKES